MDRKAIPTKLAVVGVELERLLDAIDRFQTDVTNPVFARLAITTEIDGIHVLEQTGLELGFALAGLLDQLRIHHELILTQDCVHLETPQGRVSLLKAGACAGDAVAPEAHLKRGALITPENLAFTLSRRLEINGNGDRAAQRRGTLCRSLVTTATSQHSRQGQGCERMGTSHAEAEALTPSWRGWRELHGLQQSPTSSCANPASGPDPTVTVPVRLARISS